MSDAIKRSGELLLKGWAMLNQNCPVCYTALMASSDRSETMCPSCNLPVRTEAEMRKLGQTYSEAPGAESTDDYDDDVCIEYEYSVLYTFFYVLICIYDIIGSN